MIARLNKPFNDAESVGTKEELSYNPLSLTYPDRFTSRGPSIRRPCRRKAPPCDARRAPRSFAGRGTRRSISGQAAEGHRLRARGGRRADPGVRCRRADGLSPQAQRRTADVHPASPWSRRAASADDDQLLLQQSEREGGCLHRGRHERAGRRRGRSVDDDGADGNQRNRRSSRRSSRKALRSPPASTSGVSPVRKFPSGRKTSAKRKGTTGRGRTKPAACSGIGTFPDPFRSPERYKGRGISRRRA